MMWITPKKYPVDKPEYNIPNILREEAHIYSNQGSSMVAKHK